MMLATLPAAARSRCAIAVALALTGLGTSLGTMNAARAEGIEYDPQRSGELRTCDDQRNRGRVEQARQCYTRLFNSSGDLLTQAEAAWALNNIQRANSLFQEAARINERNPRLRVRWGRLFLATHQPEKAIPLFQEALKIASADAQAKLGIAKAFAEQFQGEARPLLEQVLSADDSLPEAHILSARMYLEEGQFEDADKALDRAERLVEQQKLAPLEVWALRAMLDVTQRGEARPEWLERARSYNPRYGGIYQDLANFEVTRRRYKEAAMLYDKAVQIEPERWSAHADRGANLLRLGEVDAAREALKIAYSGDPFSVTTVNTLRLLDRTDEFTTISSKFNIPSASGGQLPVELKMRLDKKEAAALKPYVEQLSRDSVIAFAKRYDFEPREPITVELYPRHDDFAVRVAALPGIGLLGVTFGYLVAMDSPSGRATGEFHWGSTLWHEMAHVFTLEATDHHVPRWLSEGISVFEEWRTGPTPGVAVTPDVIAAFKGDKFLPIADMDSGFIRPKYPNQIQVSYMQAGLICLFVEERWGFDKVVALLKQFKRPNNTRAAVEATFKMPTGDFDKQFNAFVRERYARILPRIEEWQKSYQTAQTALEASKWNDALEPARKAIELYPEYTGPGSAYLLLAQAQEKAGQRTAAIASLTEYRKAGGWDPEALRELAGWLESAGRADEEISTLTALNYVDPMSPAHHAKLGERLLSSSKAEQSLREFQVQLALESVDPALANFGVARALRALGDTATSRRHLLDALSTAPHYKPAQEMLLKMIQERSKDE
jgi:tetratricopeptide (TPR) repeat protein